MFFIVCALLLGHDNFAIREAVTIDCIEENYVTVGRIAICSHDAEIRMRGKFILDNCDYKITIVWIVYPEDNVSREWANFWMPKINHKFRLESHDYKAGTAIIMQEGRIIGTTEDSNKIKQIIEDGK